MHGGPGAAGEMRPVARALSDNFGMLELLQTEKTVADQIAELLHQLEDASDLPVILVGHSWGAWLGCLFACRYPKKVKKLILIGAGPFEPAYAKDLTEIRLKRLKEEERKEAEQLLFLMDSGVPDDEVLRRFGELMALADTYDYLADYENTTNTDIEIYRSVWPEVNHLRDTGALLNCMKRISCPIVAFHGDYDPHPAEGVQKPLNHWLDDFRMIRLEKCGHTPWKEKQAADTFFRLLKEEL